MPVSAERQRELRRVRTERRIADWQAAGSTARANAVARKSRAGRKATAAARLPRLAPITPAPEHQENQMARHPRWPRAVAQEETHGGRNAWPRSSSRSPSGRSARREASSLPDAELPDRDGLDTAKLLTYDHPVAAAPSILGSAPATMRGRISQ